MNAIFGYFQRHKLPWLAALMIMVLLGHMVATAERRARYDGDFGVNREFGRRFLAGEPLYTGGHCFNYMPTAAMYWAPLALVPPSVGTLLRYVVALGCLAITLRMLSTMVGHSLPLAGKRPIIVGLTLVLALHYLIRDLDDGGPNLILLAMLVGGIYCAWRGREYLGATWFGLAIALKMTPGLFVPFFVWKRRWRLAFATSVATAGWILVPALWMGPSSWWQHQQQWNAVAFSVFSGHEDASREDNELRVQNQTLPLAIKRAVIDYPPGHPLRPERATLGSVVDLSEPAAGRVARLAVLVLLAICCWHSRGGYAGNDDPAWLLETSGILLVALLLSPVTWLQHMVWAIPALFLIVAEDRAGHGLPRLAKAGIWLFVLLSLVLNRELLGRENYLVLLSYHTHTLCMLLLLAMLLALRPTLDRSAPRVLQAAAAAGGRVTPEVKAFRRAG